MRIDGIVGEFEEYRNAMEKLKPWVEHFDNFPTSDKTKLFIVLAMLSRFLHLMDISFDKIAPMMELLKKENVSFDDETAKGAN